MGAYSRGWHTRGGLNIFLVVLHISAEIFIPTENFLHASNTSNKKFSRDMGVFVDN